MKTFKIKSHFREAADEVPEKPIDSFKKTGNRFKVVLIQEGLGNLRDCFYYTKGALKLAQPLFEGKKCFADHPSSLEEETRPERSTRDILGHFENVTYEEAEDGRGQLVSDLVVLLNPSYAWAQTLLSTSVGYAQKFPENEFVGLSINASGSADEVPIEDFMRETDIPPSVLPKLQQAQTEGISQLRVVNMLKDAVSCDLVTEAGAGGKILQMIEQEKKPMKQMMKQKKEHKEHKEEEMEKKEAGPGMGDEDTDGAMPDHADADQDKALFAKMIKQYLGDDADEEEAETQQMAKHAYEAHKEMGMEHKEAYEAAGNHLKMAMAIGKKMAQKQDEAHEAKEDESEAKEDESEGYTGKDTLPKNAPMMASHEHEADDEDADDGMPPKGKKPMPPMAKKEGNYKAKLIEVLGENARLKESLKKYELSKYLDTKLKESGRDNSITKRFREALGAPKSKEQIDLAYKLFMTGADASAEGADFSGFMFTEKSSFKESASGPAGTMSDCMEL